MLGGSVKRVEEVTVMLNIRIRNLDIGSRSNFLEYLGGY